MATNNIPVLLLSATCRPVAVSAITSSLMLQPSDIQMIDGELTRPEIRLIRVTMKSTLSSCDDLLRLFAPYTVTSARETVPMIIYSGTRNRTFQVMKVVNEARNTPHHEYDPNDQFIRRYHSVNSDEDKARVMDDFGGGKVPVISATMALGLGQNLKRVRCVVHMGRGDPSAIGQMVGRCGRDGNVGLGLLFMEPTRKNGRNSVAEFTPGLEQNDDMRMDALAVTSVCLRIALNLDNKCGYIPLDPNDPNVLQEQAREDRLGFQKCKCSCCAPQEAECLMNVIQQTTVGNFDSILNDPWSVPKDPRIVTMKRKLRSHIPKGTCCYPKDVAEDLVQHLLASFEVFYVDVLGPRPEFLPSVFFGIDEARAIVATIDQICAGDLLNQTLLERVIGGQSFKGQIESHSSAIMTWMNGELYKLHLHNITQLDMFIEAEGIRVRQAMADELSGLQEVAAARRHADLELKRLKKSEAKSQAAEARAAARLSKAADLAVEKARLLSEKAADKARREEEKLARLKSEAQTRAAEKATIKAQRAAENSNKAETKGGKKQRKPQDWASKKAARQLQLVRNLAARKTACLDTSKCVDEMSQEDDITMDNGIAGGINDGNAKGQEYNQVQQLFQPPVVFPGVDEDRSAGRAGRVAKPYM
ncbi:uncharacterized protein PGTG_21988 [Puccinia graminis f. sp. tritici CRL 75-36-700-3]|uniref:DNA 3'-5' helicase n=1 Tax=Puccinia graminis f. sp. tritici (strain CRL 75-36-700-3 / race SCCL) TaxID=418459 RepID=H6QT31_PUCGT|nr:uncharacterized protein PGTG_21988 [Puccinia graminis f. sp. tritici CRL 75-36-700-3]EHS63985.1 hypothetical protein PGTG_21988 [Puccinia graminis f. sp. tritici CRL 75-36-700-3]